MAALPAQMTAIAIRIPGGPEVLTAEPRPVPKPRRRRDPGQGRRRRVNRPDVMQRMGLYPPPPGAPDIPGLEIAGEVVACGTGVTRWKEGDKVMALVVGGGYAEFCIAHESHALPVPAGLSLTEAAAIPETFFTVWYNAFERGRLAARETLLVHGGSSGIGTTAIQLAAAFGARVITTAGTPEKCEACRKLGADVAINYKTEDFVAVTKQATGDRGADLVLDIVGGDYIDRNYEAAAVEGRIVQIAFQSSSRATVDFRRLMLEAADPHRLDAARPLGGGQGRHCPRRRGQSAAADRRRTCQTGDRLDFSVARGCRRPCPHGKQPAYRQDCPDPLKRHGKFLRSRSQRLLIGYRAGPSMRRRQGAGPRIRRKAG